MEALMGAYQEDVLHLEGSDVSVVIDISGDALPRIAYWGQSLAGATTQDLKELVRLTVQPWSGNFIDATPQVGILPESSRGWPGSPGLLGSRDGQDWTPQFAVTDVQVERNESKQTATFTCEDTKTELGLRIDIELSAAGLLRSKAELTNLGAGTYQVDRFSLAYPLPTEATEILDHAGRWAKERTPQRSPFNVGTHLRETWRGKTGHDNPFVTVFGAQGFGFQHGDVRGVHLGWSGNYRTASERLFSGEKIVSSGELLQPGEVRLAQGETYETPWLYGSYSESGMDAMAGRYHEHVRTTEGRVKSERPVTLNVWEAVYFDHNLTRLIDLADRAAELGVERYVLDDGWFGSRRDDTSGLGDWQVAPDMWPGDTLKQLADHVHEKGMQFGIWFEPEMINEDSELARNHPEWILKPQGRMPIQARQQQVLNIAIPDAFKYLLEAMSDVVTDLKVDYIKWDHNRDLLESGSQATGAAGIHEQTLAFYNLVDALKDRFPSLEIESCSGGGARIDLGVVDRTDRVWTSDCIDALERQDIQRWTSQLLPPEIMGSHVGDGAAHTTGRMHDIDFRAGTALFGHFGIEWDLARATENESASLREWISIYKTHRDLIHSGVTVRQDTDGTGTYLHGVVAQDKSEAIFSFVVMERSETWPIGRIKLPGLNPDSVYEVVPVKVGRNHDALRQLPNWWTAPATVSGRVLAQSGLFPPSLHPENLAVFTVREVK